MSRLKKILDAAVRGLRSEEQRHFFSVFLIVFILAFVGIGGRSLLHAHAATVPAASVEAESGTLKVRQQL